MTSQQHRGSCWFFRDCSCWKRVFLVLIVVEQNGVFCRFSHIKYVKRCWGRGDINSWSKDSVYFKLIIYSLEFNIVQIRYLIPKCVHVLCTYTWKYFVRHIMCSLLVWNDWDSSQMVVQKILSLRQQQSPSWQKIFLGIYCHLMEECFTVRLSEAVPNVRENSLSSLETEESCCFTVHWKCTK